jgi:hypothetical protein
MKGVRDWEEGCLRSNGQPPDEMRMSELVGMAAARLVAMMKTVRRLKRILYVGFRK